ncbi:MAG: TonB-dependent receptor, partial [Marinicaulis sp.]|nr:TonB-dependent receptor [Marinicaulis sp.]
PALLCNPTLALAGFQFFDPQVNFPNPADPLDNGLLQDDKVTYTARLAYDVTDNLNAYFTYSTGWKAGAVNLSSDSRPPDAAGVGRAARPEDVELFEIGIKAGFDRGYINIALFDQTINDFQSNLFIGTGFVLANAEEQSVRGFEVDTAFNPIDPLALTFSLTYLDPEFSVFTQAPCASFVGFTPAGCTPDPVTGFVPATFDASGFTPAGIHEVSLSTSATWTHDFANGAQGYIRGEYLYESDAQVVDNVAPSIASREVNILNASIGYETESGFGVQIWGRNLTDDGFLLSSFPSVGQLGSFSGYTNAPRTYGVTLRKKF